MGWTSATSCMPTARSPNGNNQVALGAQLQGLKFATVSPSHSVNQMIRCDPPKDVALRLLLGLGVFGVLGSMFFGGGGGVAVGLQ